jgi:hypothetical protein
MSKLLATYKTVRDLHAAAYAVCQQVTQMIPTHGTPKNIADGVLITRKIAELLADTEKEFKKLQTALSAAGCAWLVAKGDGEPLHGGYCSAQGRPATACEVPSRTKDPAKYARLCAIMGVQDHPLARLHYPAIKQAITERLASGKNLPPELAEYKQYNEFNLVATERSGSTLDADATQSQYII